MQEKKLYVLDLIATMDNADYQAVLIKRYFERLSWEDIISQINYSRRYTFTLHGRALEELDKRLSDT